MYELLAQAQAIKDKAAAQVQALSRWKISAKEMNDKKRE